MVQNFVGSGALAVRLHSVQTAALNVKLGAF
jgi:hypothetical protein